MFLRIVCNILNGNYDVSFYAPTSWIHLVVNYVGPATGIKVYTDGTLVGQDNQIENRNRDLRNGRVVLGRRYVYTNNNYGSAEIDELLFFNAVLTQASITQLVEMVE